MIGQRIWEQKKNQFKPEQLKKKRKNRGNTLRETQKDFLSDTQVPETEKEGGWEGEAKQAAGKAAAAEQIEEKTYSCSECGLKTPSRMIYVQHVLYGCIMDMVVGGSGEGGDNAAQQNAIKKVQVGELVPAGTSWPSESESYESTQEEPLSEEDLQALQKDRQKKDNHNLSEL